jgi:hypothetical protein
MEGILLLPKSEIIADRKVRRNLYVSNLSSELPVNDSYVDNLIAEGGENFLNYLRGLGLANRPNIMILSSRHHYCYDYNDLKGVNTLINLKKLNRMRHLDSFLFTIRRVISPDTNFIGCFSDSSISCGDGLTQRNGRRRICYSDTIKDIQFNKDEITELLESNGFNICDMTEINGITYFMTQINLRSIA